MSVRTRKIVKPSSNKVQREELLPSQEANQKERHVQGEEIKHS